MQRRPTAKLATTSETVVVVGDAHMDIIKADLANQVVQGAPLVTLLDMVPHTVLCVVQDIMLPLLDLAAAAGVVLTKTKREN